MLSEPEDAWEANHDLKIRTGESIDRLPIITPNSLADLLSRQGFDQTEAILTGILKLINENVFKLVLVGSRFDMGTRFVDQIFKIDSRACSSTA